MIPTLISPKEGAKKPLPGVDVVGGKGHGLYWLMFHRFPAPLTWVLTTSAFDVAIQHNKLEDQVASITHMMRDLRDSWAALQQAMDALDPERMALARTLEQTELPTHVAAALETLPQAHNQWAVRSSATVEDSQLYSFAGQFRSLLSVPRERLGEAVCQVWASTFYRHALSYCAQNHAPMPRMAVILQPMDPIGAEDRSGVVFSHSRVPGLPGVLIQATFGSGEIVVRGHGGDLYSVQGTAVQAQPMPPDQIQVTAQGGNTEAAALPSGLALDEDEARQLAKLVLSVAKQWGQPVNVEFVWRKGKEPVLVQVRSVVEPRA